MLNEHVFNIHDLVQLMTAGLSLLLAAPLFLRSRRHIADLPLALFLVAQAVVASSYVFLYSEIFAPLSVKALAPFHFLPLTLAYLAQGAALLWYGYALVQQPMRWHRADLIATGFLLTAILGNAVVKLFISDTPLAVDESGAIAPSPALLISIILGTRAIRVANQYNKEIREQFSNIDDSNLIWLTYAACGFVGIWIWRWLGAEVVSNYPAALLISAMVILGLGQRPKSIPGAGKTGSDEEAQESSTTLAKHGEKLQDLMDRVRVYQDPELNLEGLADSMGISTRSLSTVINSHFGKNFYDFVNHFRIEDAKAQLLDPDNPRKSIQRIFEDVGFNSKSTFNSTFKKATGKTPSEFRREAGAN